MSIGQEDLKYLEEIMNLPAEEQFEVYKKLFSELDKHKGKGLPHFPFTSNGKEYSIQAVNEQAAEAKFNRLKSKYEW